MKSCSLLYSTVSIAYANPNVMFVNCSLNYVISYKFMTHWPKMFVLFLIVHFKEKPEQACIEEGKISTGKIGE